MRDRDTQTVQGGISIFTIVQAAFIIMKVAGVVKWPWWKVFIPVYIELGIAALVILIAVVACLISGE